MSALTIKKVKTWSKPDFCCCRCEDRTVRAHEMGFRAASHVATICGHDFPLCAHCAKDWRTAWDSALGSTRDQRLAA